ncbi:MAG: tRNA pseudouridine(38-40) synthase TruA [Acetobacteraceae bacterium]|nr:tRNA pseudouridine(38-40) synthase TruA [Acetobacteraceae bacterium]
MNRSWVLQLEYDGAPYVGWQRQQAGCSIQQILESAAAMLNRGEPVASIVAGRTDAGVHAEAQVVQIALGREYSPGKLREALNYHMKPHPVVVLAAAPAPTGWNARFCAIKRIYRYRILNRPARPALLAHRVWHVPQTLNAAAMQAAALSLLGRHDFSSFRAAACQATSPLRTLDRLDVTRSGDIIEITAEARSFLHHQVRNMVGTLRLVGEERWPVSAVAQALAARDRAAAGPTAPASGLTLVGVRYPVDPFTLSLGIAPPEGECAAKPP